MKERNRKKIFVFCSTLVPSILLLAVFCFHFFYKAQAEENESVEINSGDILINEIQLSGGTGKSKEEFIELYNKTDFDIDLNALSLKLHIINSNNSDDNKTLTFVNNIIPPKSYFLITSKDYKEKTSDKDIVDATYSTSGNTLVPNGALYISTSENIIDFLGLGSNSHFDSQIIKNPKDGTSSERISLEKNDWQESCLEGGTPGRENSICEKDDDSQNNQGSNNDDQYFPIDPGKLIINEIFPRPNKNDPNEKTGGYIEIYNPTDSTIKLFGLYMKDAATNSKKYSFPENYELKSHEFFVICKNFYEKICNDNYNFILNSTTKEAVYLFGKNDEIIDSASYNSPKENKSYSFDGATWRWSSFLTPGKNNEFDKKLSAKIIMADKIYKNFDAVFEAKAEKNVKKFTWDFGDGRKSHLQKTKHKYEKTGTYQASLKITGDGEENLYEFTVKVENYDAPSVKIIALSPNPKGKDTGNEWILIENYSSKKINLKDWKIASGTQKLINHPITKDFILKKDEIKKLTRKHCAFTLPNKEAKLELRSPDGKTVQKIKYSKDKISEDETYEKIGRKWEWISFQNNIEDELTDTQAPSSTSQEVDENASETPIQEKIIDPAIQAAIGKFSPNPDWQKNQEFQIILATSDENIKIPEKYIADLSHVLGANSVRLDGNHYVFTPIAHEKHWFVKIMNNALSKINSGLNQIFFESFAE
jgi:hypothetical protein